MLQYGIALFTILVFLVFFIRKPNVETYVLFVLTVLPFMNTKILPLAYGFVKAFDIITIIAFSFLLKEFLTVNPKIQHGLYLILAFLFCIITIVSGVNSEFGFQSYYTYYPLFTTVIFIRFLFIYFVKSKDNFWLSLKAFKVGFIMALIFMTLQIIIGPKFNLYADVGLNVLNEETGIVRYSGIFSESQINGQYLAMGSFVFLLFNEKVKVDRRYLSYLVFGISILYLLLAGSRSAMGGFLIGIIFLFILSNLRIKVFGILLGVIAVIGMFLFAPENGIFSRTDNLGSDLDFRQSIWEETYKIIQDFPLLGIGLGNFEEFTYKYYQDLYLEISPGEFLYFSQPENGYLKILVEHGALAFSIFCLFFLIPVFKIIKDIFLQKLGVKDMFLVAAIGSWLTAFNTVYSLSDYRILLTVAFLSYCLVYDLKNIKTIGYSC